ncbi:hypothetical protein B0T21DRAFT_359386 [Apiosordaria backusii]|uniref:Uncharacterized protein n=1 Tax=Apiosordaria backusii TaxID=314023 RepID=A0AA40ETP1_9PEZI|nr:hypothetical protein B0T21DRAFT_359386 [Apiosordaria backusii]
MGEKGYGSSGRIFYFFFSGKLFLFLFSFRLRFSMHSDIPMGLYLHRTWRGMAWHGMVWYGMVWEAWQGGLFAFAHITQKRFYTLHE